MPNQSTEVQVQDALMRAVNSGLLSKDDQDHAQDLLARLQKPVRLTLLGMPGSGKSSVLNLLAGTTVLPAGVKLPTLQLFKGDSAQAICTLPDGSKQTIEGANATDVAALSPVFVEMHLPLPALGKISILEVVAPADPNAVHKAGQWASKRSDIILWCTSNFNETEQRIWRQMPDHIKDHGLLLITHMDILQEEGSFDGIAGAARTAAMGEFDKIVPIDVPRALRSRAATGGVDKDMMRGSGGTGLISAVLKQVDEGKQAAIDMAEVLLLQNAIELAELEDTPEPAPVAATPAPPAAPEPVAVAPAPVAAPEQPSDSIAKLRNLAASRAAEDPPAAPDLKPDTRAAYQTVITYIEDRAQELTAQLGDMGEKAPSQIIAKCVEHVQWLSDFLNDNGDASDQSLQRARDTAFDAADLIQLMQLEKRDSAALEAVSLMLQVKRELQADLAA
jgi:hypothetical protein